MAAYGDKLDMTVRAFLCWGNTLRRRRDWRAMPERGGTDVFVRMDKSRHDILHLTECDKYQEDKRVFTAHYHNYLTEEEEGETHKKRHLCCCGTRLYHTDRVEVLVADVAITMGYWLGSVQPNEGVGGQEEEDYEWAVENGDEFRRFCRNSHDHKEDHIHVCDLIDPRTDDDDNRRLFYYGAPD